MLELRLVNADVPNKIIMVNCVEGVKHRFDFNQY